MGGAPTELILSLFSHKKWVDTSKVKFGGVSEAEVCLEILKLPLPMHTLRDTHCFTLYELPVPGVCGKNPIIESSNRGALGGQNIIQETTNLPKTQSCLLKLSTFKALVFVGNFFGSSECLSGSVLALILVPMFMLNLLITTITTTPGLDRCKQNRDVHGWLGRKVVLEF